MRALHYVAGVLFPFVGGIAEVLADSTHDPISEYVAHAVLVVAVATGAYLLVRGGHYGRKRVRSAWALAGHVLTCLVGGPLLLLGAPLTSSVISDWLSYAFCSGPDPMAHTNMNFLVTTLILGPVAWCLGVAVLIAAGRIGTVSRKVG